MSFEVGDLVTVCNFPGMKGHRGEIIEIEYPFDFDDNDYNYYFVEFEEGTMEAHVLNPFPFRAVEIEQAVSTVPQWEV